MAATQITIEKPGPLSTLQDEGRFGLRHLGIPWSGALTTAWQQVANTLVGNPPHHSIIEAFEGGLRFNTGPESVRVAVMAAPDLQMHVNRTDPQHATVASATAGGDRSTSLKPGRSYILPAHSSVTLASTGRFRHAVLAVEGLQAESQLGSSSTYAKAGLGGINGHALTAGNCLTVSAASRRPDLHYRAEGCPDYDSGLLRVVMGPQDDHFSEAGLTCFLSSEYELSREADRMGARLTGPAITHRDEQSRDIVSDAIVPGSIQVPGNGQPIVLLNDAHTAGGYPKIATVISIDLPLLGLRRAGTRFRFKAISVEEAIDAVRQHWAALSRSLESMDTVRDYYPTTEALLSKNLIDGVTDGQVDDT